MFMHAFLIEAVSQCFKTAQGLGLLEMLSQGRKRLPSASPFPKALQAPLMSKTQEHGDSMLLSVVVRMTTMNCYHSNRLW